jgi:hypothetical protein
LIVGTQRRSRPACLRGRPCLTDAGDLGHAVAVANGEAQAAFDGLRVY